MRTALSSCVARPHLNHAAVRTQSKNPRSTTIVCRAGSGLVAVQSHKNAACGAFAETAALAFSCDPTTHHYCWPWAADIFYRQVVELTWELYDEPVQLWSAAGTESFCISYTYPLSDPTFWTYLKSGAYKVLFTILPWRLSELMTVSDQLDRIKKRFYEVHGPFCYVFVLATRPNSQGQGLATLIMTEVARLADSQKMCCYLEATSFQARQWYVRFGFRDLTQVQLNARSPTTYVMWRPAAVDP